MGRRALAASLLALAGAAPAASADVTTFAYGNARLGSTRATTITAARAGRLLHAWRTDVGGAVNTQPLVVGGRVLVGEEHGSVVALAARTGRVLWRHRVGTRTITSGCGAGPDDRVGVTGTLVADPRAGRVYAVDARGLAWALRLTDGHVVAGWPVRVHRPGPDFVWSALSLASGHLYVPVASLCDDGRYRGGIAAVDTTTRAVTRWETTAGTSSYAGGIWAWGGVSIDPAGDVFAATGNSLGPSGEADGNAERVLRLGADLALKTSNYPLAPPFAAGDRDFGSTPLLLDAPGCAPQLAVLNKTGELFLYERDHLTAGPVQRLRVAGALGVPLYGDLAYDPGSRTLVYTSPSTPPGASPFRRGVQAVRLTTACRLALRWQAAFPSDAGSAPMIGRDVVYLASGPNGYLCAYRLRDGRRVWTGTLSKAGAMAAPTVAGPRLYAADWAGRVWAFRLP